MSKNYWLMNTECMDWPILYTGNNSRDTVSLDGIYIMKPTLLVPR